MFKGGSVPVDKLIGLRSGDSSPASPPVGADQTSILVVEDEPQVCSPISTRLESCGFDCQTSSDPPHAKEILAGQRFGVLIADIAMPVVNGLELLVHARQHAPGCKVIPITGKSDRQALAQALMLGAYEYLEKPLGMDGLAAAVAWGWPSGVA